MALRNRSSSKKVAMMKAAPTTDMTEVTFSAKSKARFSEDVNDMTVALADNYLHMDRARRSWTSVG